MSSYLLSTKRHILSMMLLLFLIAGVAGVIGESHAATDNDLQAAFTYLSPRPGAEQVSTGSAIAIRTRRSTGNQTD